MMASIGVLLIALTVCIATHELGHLVAALSCRLTVESIQLGRGPGITLGTIQGCSIRVAILPLGGEVRLRDEAESQSDALVAQLGGFIGSLLLLLVSLAILSLSGHDGLTLLKIVLVPFVAWCEAVYAQAQTLPGLGVWHCAAEALASMATAPGGLVWHLTIVASLSLQACLLGSDGRSIAVLLARLSTRSREGCVVGDCADTGPIATTTGRPLCQ